MSGRESSVSPWVWMAIPFYLVGLAGHAFAPWREFFLSLTPAFLYASAFFFLGLERGRPNVRRFFVWFVPVYAMTLGLEILGVHTGWVFGSYEYTPLLGASVAEVPLVIGLNWVLVVWGAGQIVQKVWGRAIPVVKALVVAVVCVGFDVLLEPVAIHLGYWVWVGDVPPLQNYLAWGAIAFVTSWYGYRVYFTGENKAIAWNFVFQSIFFLALNVMFWANVVPTKTPA